MKASRLANKNVSRPASIITRLSGSCSSSSVAASSGAIIWNLSSKRGSPVLIEEKRDPMAELRTPGARVSPPRRSPPSPLNRGHTTISGTCLSRLVSTSVSARFTLPPLPEKPPSVCLYRKSVIRSGPRARHESALAPPEKAAASGDPLAVKPPVSSSQGVNPFAAAHAARLPTRRR